MPDTLDGPQQRSRGIILAFDYGLRRIGVAAGNGITQSATALMTLTMSQGEPPWDAIDRLVAEWSPEQLVVGDPGVGGSTSIAEQAGAFSTALQQRYGLPVARVDEALTSVAAASQLAEARRSGARSRRIKREMIDSQAARLIAEQYLNSG